MHLLTSIVRIQSNNHIILDVISTVASLSYFYSNPDCIWVSNLFSLQPIVKKVIKYNSSRFSAQICCRITRLLRGDWAI